jgi:hypothetical protein
MPAKRTRNERFNLSFVSFIKECTTNFRRGCEAEDFMQRWSLALESAQTVSNEHIYLFKLLRSVLYEQDHGDQTDVIYADDNAFPTKEEFETYFTNHYRQHYQFNGRHKVAFVECENLVEKEGSLEMNIVVVYNRAHQHPYPEPIMSTHEEELAHNRLRFNMLEMEYENQIAQNGILRRNNNRLRNVAKARLAKTQTHIRALYAKCPEKEDCPVCYECITPELLKVSKCFHYICVPCAERCTVCPICRDKY